MKLAMSLLLASSFAFAQDKPKPVDVKSTPASDALVAAAKESKTERDSIETIRQQAISTLQSSQKSLGDELTSTQKQLTEDLNKDKKYKPMVDKIADLQKKIQDLGQTASAKFNKDTGEIQVKIASDNALINGLVPIVKKENGLPDDAVFDQNTQKWTVPTKPEDKK